MYDPLKLYLKPKKQVEGITCCHISNNKLTIFKRQPTEKVYTVEIVFTSFKLLLSPHRVNLMFSYTSTKRVFLLFRSSGQRKQGDPKGALQDQDYADFRGISYASKATRR